MEIDEKMGYDRASTMFSPDGRLLQVEYARESIKKGTTSIGIKGKDGAALVVEKYPGNKLVIMESIEKIFEIDNHIGIAASGLIGDARILIDRARIVAHSNHISFGEPIDVGLLTKDIANMQQFYTQNGGLRPFGTSLLVIGMDEDGSTHLFETDPSGSMLEYRAAVVGKNKGGIITFIEDHYNEDMTIEECVMLAIDALHDSDVDTFDPSIIEIGVIEKRDQKFFKLGFDAIKDFAYKTQEKNSGEVNES